MGILVTATDSWALWALLLLCAASGFWFEKSYAGARVSGPIITMLLAFALSNAGIIPAQSPVYDTIWRYLLLLAIPLLLFQANIKQIFSESGKTLLALLLGLVGVLLGVLLAYWLIPVGTSGWQVAASFMAQYMGGSENYNHVASSLALSNKTLLEGGKAAAHLVFMFYFIILFLLVSIRTLRMQFKEGLTDRWGPTAVVVVDETRKGSSIYVPTLSTGLALSAAICALGVWAESELQWQGVAILVVTVVSVVLALALPKAMAKIEGSNEFGILLMQLLFAVVGASANVSLVAKLAPVLLAVAIIIVVVHLLFVIVVGRWLRLSLPEIVIASNAAIGGPLTAAAMTSARRWHHLIVPAVLCGTIGYAIANYVALWLGNFLK